MATTQKKESFKIVPPGKKKCVWMEAGVVSYKLCDNNFDCPTCTYDQAMQTKVAREREKSMERLLPAEQIASGAVGTWRERMLALPAVQRKCRYTISGHVDNKVCPNNYECGSCAYDQMMQERLESVGVTPQLTKEVGGVKVVDGYYYHEGHTWARPEHGGRVRVGLDDFARRLLGSLSRVSLPQVGEELSQGKDSFEIARNGGSVRGLSPVDGTVTHINFELLDNPELVHNENYDNGWLFIVEPSKLKGNLKKLMFGEDVESFMMREKDLLIETAGREMRLAADGAIVLDDIASELEDDQWSQIARKFLRS